jgi:hypothetical protein
MQRAPAAVLLLVGALLLAAPPAARASIAPANGTSEAARSVPKPLAPLVRLEQDVVSATQHFLEATRNFINSTEHMFVRSASAARNHTAQAPRDNVTAAERRSNHQQAKAAAAAGREETKANTTAAAAAAKANSTHAASVPKASPVPTKPVPKHEHANHTAHSGRRLQSHWALTPLGARVAGRGAAARNATTTGNGGTKIRAGGAAAKGHGRRLLSS